MCYGQMSCLYVGSENPCLLSEPTFVTGVHLVLDLWYVCATFRPGHLGSFIEAYTMATFP